MATPAYQGQGQPSADFGGGLFGRFGSFFGGSTPSYAGVGQPTSASGALGGSAVAYAPPPAAKPETSSPSGATADASTESDAEVLTCAIDPEALASGHIAIVIPRERLGPCIDNP